MVLWSTSHDEWVAGLGIVHNCGGHGGGGVGKDPLRFRRAMNA